MKSDLAVPETFEFCFHLFGYRRINLRSCQHLRAWYRNGLANCKSRLREQNTNTATPTSNQLTFLALS